MPLGTNDQTITTGSVFRPNIWATDVMTFLQNILVFLPRIKHYDAEVSSKGQTVEIPFVTAGTANDKAANTQVTLDGTTFSKVTVTINKHKEKSYLIEDLLKVQSAYDLRSEFTSAAAYAIQVAIDSDIYTELLAGITSTAVGVFGTALVDATVVAAKQTLDQNLAPQDNRTLAVDPAGLAQLLQIDKFVRYDALGSNAGGDAIRNGRVGMIYGFEVVMSQNIPVVAGTPAQHSAIAFHRDVQAIAHQQKPRMQAQYKQEYLGWLLTVDTVYGVKTLRPTFGVVVKY